MTLMVVIILCIVGIAIFIYLKMTEKQRKFQNLQNRLLDLFEIFIKYTGKYNLQWWASDGTLLGAVRENNIISWDDDVDVAAPPETIEFLRSKTEELKALGLKFALSDHIWRFKYSTPGGVYIDVFEMDLTPDGKWKYADEYNTERWEKAWFNESEVLPLKMYKFGKLTIPGPNNPIPSLERLYGDWKTPLYQQGHHEI